MTSNVRGKVVRMTLNPELGRKVQVPVMLTTRLLDKVDDIATREANGGGEANRSKVLRRLVAKGIEAEEREGGK